jgi:hypothetical protein
MCAGFMVVTSSLKFLASFDWKRKKELPMTHAFVLATRSVSETLWTIGASYIAAALPGLSPRHATFERAGRDPCTKRHHLIAVVGPDLNPP